MKTEDRTPALDRIQRELAETAVIAQMLRNRLLNNGHKGLAQRVGTAAIELASVVAVMGNPSAIPHFREHFQHSGKRAGHTDSDHALVGVAAAPE